MEKLTLSLILSLWSFLACNLYAQERKTLTTQLEGGTLTFQYYERDGVKIPDGPMEFKKGNYTEKGECKDGFREGRWTAQKGNSKFLETKEYSFSKGMLEGPTIFKTTGSEKSSYKLLKPDATYNFHNGRLYGENKVVHHSDTIYCNFGENGKRIGTWKILNSEGGCYILEYNDNPELRKAYQVDVLGQKEEIDFGKGEMKAFMPLLVFDDLFRQVIFSLTDRKRPKLPTLCDNKYGYESAWVKIDED